MNSENYKKPSIYELLTKMRWQSWSLLSLCLMCSIFSIVDSPESFSRSGAVLVVVGFILIASTSFLSYSTSIEGAMIKKNDYAKIMPDRGSELYMQRQLETRVAVLEENIGVILTILGTVIWAYGDKILS